MTTYYFKDTEEKGKTLLGTKRQAIAYIKNEFNRNYETNYKSIDEFNAGESCYKILEVKTFTKGQVVKAWDKMMKSNQIHINVLLNKLK